MNIAKLDVAATSAGAPAGDDRSDVERLITVFRRRSRIFSAVAAVILAAVVVITLELTPSYTATATVMIDTRKHDIANIQEVESGLPADSSVVDTEVEILKSRSLAGRVVTALGLDNDPEFNPSLAQPTLLGAPMAFIGQVFGGAPEAPAAAAREADALAKQKTHEAVVDNVLSHLSIRRSGLTYVIDIGFDSRNPTKAARIANAFADKYLLEQLESKYEATKQATAWLDQRLAELQPQVEAADAAVQQYKAQHGLLASVGSTLTEQQISNLNAALDQAKADAAEKDARVSTAKSEAQTGSNGENLSGPLNSQTMMQLRAQQAAASSKVADLETKYGPKHPAVQQAQRELADTNAQISQEVARNVSNLQTEDSVARQRVASLEGSLSNAKGTLVGNNLASVQLDELQRRADAASALYDSLLTRVKQTSVDQGSEQSDSRVVSHAEIPNKPSSPNKQLNLALGLALALAGGLGSVFLMETLDSGLTTASDVERDLGLPHIGNVPLLQSTSSQAIKSASPADYITEKPLSAFAEAFRNLRASIVFSRIEPLVRVIALTSSLPGEGKTTTALCLARSMALSGSKIVIVDCDMRRNSLSRLVGAAAEVGLVEVLLGAAKLEDALVKDPKSDAYVLPLAESVYTPKDLFGSKAMDNLLGELRERFDYVLLDTAPVIPVSDTRVLTPKADVVVFLVEWRKTPKKAVQSALSLLSSVGSEIVGVALTQVDMREQAKFGYGDPGYYYNRYRKYYTQ